MTVKRKGAIEKSTEPQKLRKEGTLKGRGGEKLSSGAEDTR